MSVSRNVALGDLGPLTREEGMPSDLRFLGAPGRSRTCDLEIRSRILYVRPRPAPCVLSVGEGVIDPSPSGLIRLRPDGWRSNALATSLPDSLGEVVFFWTTSRGGSTVLAMTSDRTQIAKIAANARWAKCDDRSAATQAARDGMTRRFELEVDPDRKLLPEERARRAESVRRAYYQRLALKSAQSRRAKKEKAMTPEQERLEVERLQNEGLVAQGLPPVDRSRPVSRRQKAIDAAGDLAAEHDIAMAAMTPREQAEAAYTPVPCYCHNVVHSIDELEDMIRADRGLPPLDRGGEADEVRRDDGA